MPLQKIENNQGNPWALWRIEEDETTFRAELDGVEMIPEVISQPHKRLEWFAGRLLVKSLMEQVGLTFRGIVKDEFGKPFPAESSWQLSLSHSYPYVAAYLNHHHAVGIDLQHPKDKLLRIAPRILDPEELATAGQDIIKHCVIWCAKEVLIKVHGKKDLIFAKNLKISPFSMNSRGNLFGRIIVNQDVTVVPLYYEVHPAFTIVLNKP
jgi:4'-phosphopantetheinyl transferase